MANDPVLRMLGLARRAGKLAYGDELVREVCFAHKAGPPAARLPTKTAYASSWP